MQEQQEQESGPAVAVDNPSLPRMESVNRISKIPIVESAWGVAAGFYGKVKDSNGMVNWTLNHAEAVSTAALVPVATRLETPLNAVDNMLCKGIDIVEEKVPAIKMPPRQMLDTTKEYVVSGLGLNTPGPDAPATAKIIGAGLGVATAGMRTAVSAVEWFVDRYLPPSKDEDEGPAGEDKAVVPAKEGGSGAGVQDDVKDVLLRLKRVTIRLQRRLVQVASTRIEKAKQRVEDTKAKVGGVVKYLTSVVTDPKAVALQLGTAWTEFAKDLQSEEGDKGKGYPRVIARRLGRRVLAAADSALSTIPAGVYARFIAAANYGISIIGALLIGPSKKIKDEPSSEGQSSDERAKLLCMRQEKGTSPPPSSGQPSSRTSDFAAAAEDKQSGAEDKARAASTVPTNDKVSESIAVAN